MSWVQWQGEVWPTTENEAELHLHLWPPDAGCPRQSWSWSLHHIPREPGQELNPPHRRWIGAEILDLNFQEEDWRRLANREIRADAAWHDLHESTNEYGHLNVSEVQVRPSHVNPPVRPPGHRPHQIWDGHDFIFRLGEWQGFVIPVELDAWVIPHEEYYRLHPESEAEVARFAEGPPNLRVMARTRFSRCSVVLGRCEDPVPRAREYLRQAIGLHAPLENAKISWNSYHKLPDGNSKPRPGWTSTVEFTLPTEE